MYRLTYSDRVEYVCETHYTGYDASVKVEVVDDIGNMCAKCEEQKDELLS